MPIPVLHTYAGASLLLLLCLGVLHAQTIPSKPLAPPKVPPALQARLDAFAADLTRAESRKDLPAQAAALRDIGYITLDDLRQTDRAADTFTRALPIAQAAGDRRDEALILLGIAVVDYRRNMYPEGLELAQRQLALGRTLNDPEILARAGIVSAFAYDRQNKLPLALQTARQSLVDLRRIPNQVARLRTLSKLADLLRILAEAGAPDLPLMLSVSSEELLLARTAKEPLAEAHALYDAAKVEALSGHPRQALDGYTQALALLSAQQDAYGMRSLLLDRADTFRQLNDLPQALADVEHRIHLLEQTGDRRGVIQTRIFAADMLADLGRFDEALPYATQGLQEAREARLRDVEAYALTIISGLYLDLGQGKQSIDFSEQALAILRQTGPENKVADVLRIVGSVQRNLLNDPAKAIAALTQALEIYTESHDQVFQVETLNSLCFTYSAAPQPPLPSGNPKAIAICNQALTLARAIGNATAEKEALLGTGEVYASLGNREKAVELYNLALPLVTAGNKPQEQSDLFFDLMKVYRQDKPTLAIFFGKQSINLLQRVRGNIQHQTADLQTGFLKTYEDRYRTLAAILIDQGRLPEAQQVLDLLKQQEFQEYNRSQAIRPTSALDLTPAEQQAAADYERTSQTLIAESEQFARLKKLPTRTPAEDAEYERLSASLSYGSKGLNAFYDRLYILFGKNAQANKQLADVKGTAALIKQQIARSPHTVALWTLVNSTRLSILVITPTAIVARETPVAESDLNACVQDLRHALQNVNEDPRPAAQKLYRILVAPIQQDLDQASAETIIWSLDGVLRYVPMAALHDGSRFLIERYNSVNFTPVASTYLADKPILTGASAVGMGVSMQFDKDLIALPAVATELRQVVHEPQAPAGGALPGAILLDAAFTEKSMEARLNGQPRIVHIASHFVSRSGDDRRSYLLLAGRQMRDPEGYHLTVADFRDNERISLENTDLLTLSACDTGLSRADSDGREVDGLAATAQLKGAKAVLSSLWEVNDTSTGVFMADFYKRWVAGNGALMKVEAIRQTQLDLLLNRNPPVTSAFTHPFFWAPFVLVGNWR